MAFHLSYVMFMLIVLLILKGMKSNTLEYYGTDPKIDPTIEYLLPEEIKGRERCSKDVFKLREAPSKTC